jgi:hypothetical protein
VASTGGKYTSEQRAAIAAAVNGQGMSAPDVVRAAAAGDLAGELEPFVIPEGTVRDIAAHAQREAKPRGNETPAQDGLDDLLDGIRVTLTADLSAIKEKQAKGEPASRSLGQLISATRQYASLLRDVQGGKAPPGPAGEPESGPEPDDGVVKQLLRDIEKARGHGALADTTGNGTPAADEAGSSVR